MNTINDYRKIVKNSTVRIISELEKKRIQLMINNLTNRELEMIKFCAEVELRERDIYKAI